MLKIVRIPSSFRASPACFMAVAPAYAHHSFAATYFEDKTVTVDGKLVQFMFRNPHSFVHVEAPDEKGMVRCDSGNDGRTALADVSAVS